MIQNYWSGCVSISLDWQILMQIYTTFIRLVPEYTSQVWDGWSALDEENLQKVQLKITRTVTDLPLFASRNVSYLETVLVSLS